MTYYIYQEVEKFSYLTLVEEVTVDKINRMHKIMLTEKYGSFSRFIHQGWGEDIVGWMYIRNLSPLRKVKTYIFKQRL